MRDEARRATRLSIEGIEDGIDGVPLRRFAWWCDRPLRRAFLCMVPPFVAAMAFLSRVLKGWAKPEQLGIAFSVLIFVLLFAAVGLWLFLAALFRGRTP